MEEILGKLFCTGTNMTELFPCGIKGNEYVFQQEQIYHGIVCNNDSRGTSMRRNKYTLTDLIRQII